MQQILEAVQPELRSFRDPAGTLLRADGRILRRVDPSAVPDLDAFLQTKLCREAVQNGSLIGTWSVLGSPNTYEHTPVPFPSYSYEWPPEMLLAAAETTLDLAEQALEEGFGLKDATPDNLLYRGAKPVFVDILSFERREPLDARWMAYGQFVRMFVLPLLAQKLFGMPLSQTLTANRDGLDPETVYRWIGPLRKWLPPYLGLLTLPHLLGAGKAEQTELYRPKPSGSAEQARYILGGLLQKARRQLEAVAPSREADSTWSGYLDHKSLYSPAQLAQKEKFVGQALDLARPQTLLDVGANEGHFSLMAAKRGTSVVAIDTDVSVVGSIWKQASRANLDVLPLVADITRPTPATGWRNRENLSFLERASGRFDMVSLLAVVHHILVTERVPLDELLDLADQLSRRYVLVEFVGPQDPMFRRILRGREKLYAHVSREWFEASAQARFELIRSEKIDGLDRWLYLFQKRSVTS